MTELLQPSQYDTRTNAWAVFFWRPPGFMSNWTHSPFTYDGYHYNNAEQAIMHLKARVFKDKIVAAQILATPDPGQQRLLGRRVAHYDESVWNAMLESKLVDLLMAKFEQHPLFAQALKDTGDKKLFEASARDRKWGTGTDPAKSVHVKEGDHKVISRWGENLLGKALMEVRTRLC
ncbi:hypothetical protein BC832DRAFT_542446 [Gaertneriomyces semiglobifer]|nr:hypothetical protein BC832DRAFT_542446 [Gaertneriomyces semiglobifer]